MKTKLLIMMAVLGHATYINVANADEASATTSSESPTIATEATAEATAGVAKKAAAPVKKAGFSIPEGAELSVALLDKCWDNREDMKNQKVLADYLITKPAIPSDYETAWKLARLVYFVGNFGVGKNRFVKTEEGVKLFNYGAKAGELAAKLEPGSVEGHYWYAVDLGSYGLAKGIIASASNAKPGMKALEVAKGIDASYQNYGSSRVLGRYYNELPGLFGGDKDKALILMLEATKMAPKARVNWVFLGRYYLSTKNYTKAQEICGKAKANVFSVDGKYEDIRYVDEATKCEADAQAKL
jgi:hypothetical protein